MAVLELDRHCARAARQHGVAAHAPLLGHTLQPEPGAQCYDRYIGLVGIQFLVRDNILAVEADRALAAHRLFGWHNSPQSAVGDRRSAVGGRRSAIAYCLLLAA